MKRLTLFFICYISVYNVFAQEQKTIVDSTFIDGVPFKSVNEFYIFGDVAVIGNNILSKDSKKPFNDRLEDNDNIKMKYVFAGQARRMARVQHIHSYLWPAKTIIPIWYYFLKFHSQHVTRFRPV